MRDYQPFLNSCIYFNSSAGEKEKEDVKSLVLQTCQQIEKKNAGEIVEVLGNIEFIIYKPIEGDSVDNIDRSPNGGVILKSCWRCFIIYYLPKGLQHRETQLYILAHEFAHAFYKHPIYKPQPSRVEIEELDRKANEKAREWGFRLHADDIVRNSSYEKYFGKTIKIPPPIKGNVKG